MPDIMEQTSPPSFPQSSPTSTKKDRGKERAQQEEITKCLKSYTLQKKSRLFLQELERFHSAFKMTEAGNSGVLSPTHSPAPFLSVPKSRHHRVPYK